MRKDKAKDRFTIYNDQICSDTVAKAIAELNFGISYQDIVRYQKWLLGEGSFKTSGLVFLYSHSTLRRIPVYIVPAGRHDRMLEIFFGSNDPNYLDCLGGISLSYLEGKGRVHFWSASASVGDAQDFISDLFDKTSDLLMRLTDCDMILDSY